MKKINILLTVCAAMICSGAMAQNTVKGQVLNENLIYFLSEVRVTERDADNRIVAYTQTNPRGEFQLDVVDPEHEICFECYPYYEVRRKFQKEYVIEMKPTREMKLVRETPDREYGKPAPIDLSVFDGLAGLASVSLVDKVGDEKHVTVNGINFVLEENGEATVDYNFSTTVKGDIVIPESITCNNKTYKVTAIGNMAFWDCGDMKSVTIPASVTRIEACAFGACSGLEEVVLPARLKTVEPCTFYQCKNLKKVEIPESVTAIGDYAFSHCALESITLNSAKPIICPENAFDLAAFFEATLNAPKRWKADDVKGSAWVQFRK